MNTWSEEWQHECEVRAVLKVPKAERGAFCNRAKDESCKKVERGVIAMCRLRAAEELRGWMEKLTEACANKK